MRVLALIGSYRRSGNTARIVDMVRARMEALALAAGEPLEFETLYLGHLSVLPCRGCRSCFDRGEETCPIQDDLRTVRAKIDAASGIIVASPVYVDDVSGITKNWIDRLAYLCHRPALAGKCAYLLATVGDSPAGHALRTMNTAARTWGLHVVGQKGLRMGALLPEPEVATRHGQQAARVAESLFKAISRRPYLRPSFVDLVVFAIQQQAWQKATEPSLDRDYWQGKGWLDPGRRYYFEVSTARVKAALARLVGLVVARFVT